MLSKYPIDLSTLTVTPASLGEFKEKRNFRRDGEKFVDDGPMLDDAGRQMYSIDVIVSDGREMDRATIFTSVDGARAFASLHDSVELEGLSLVPTARDGRAQVKLIADSARITAASAAAPAAKPSVSKQQRLTDI